MPKQQEQGYTPFIFGQNRAQVGLDTKPSDTIFAFIRKPFAYVISSNRKY